MQTNHVGTEEQVVVVGIGRRELGVEGVELILSAGTPDYRVASVGQF